MPDSATRSEELALALAVVDMTQVILAALAASCWYNLVKQST